MRRLRLPPLPPASPKHTEERLKLGANGLQTLALTVIGTDFVVPFLNPGRQVGFWNHFLFAVPACFAIGAAHMLLRYIPVPAPAQEKPDV